MVLFTHIYLHIYYIMYKYILFIIFTKIIYLEQKVNPNFFIRVPHKISKTLSGPKVYKHT